jgi:predicted naringenin-chalcone synthase
VLLTRFVATRPPFEITQTESLAWLADAHVAAGAKRERIERAIQRVACGPDRIARRGQSLGELASLDLKHPAGAGTATRTRRFAEVVDAYFTSAYAEEPVAPDDLVHVTCTGYVSPNGAQKLVARRGWPTRVTTAYHMGCYAALPALRIAGGFLATGSTRVDLAHTELCSLHVDPSQHELEQLVVQSLFADGLIRYCAVQDQGTRGLAVRALHERVLPDSADAMTWVVGDEGMAMTLSREVPARIASSLRGFVTELLAKAGRGVQDLRRAIVAVHPGGPKIIDRVRDVLELDDAQVAESRAVLLDHGNMSSATLPHIWMRLLADPRVPAGTLIPTFAFGPGLTVTGALLEKR